MDASEARTILAERLARYREYPYERLAQLVGSQRAEEQRGQAGTLYQLEFEFFWDDRPDGNVRVIGGVDDGGIRAFLPLTESFIKAPDGSFVGEQGGSPG
jgi:hypothetical protein